jgi:hypothetical protein
MLHFSRLVAGGLTTVFPDTGRHLARVAGQSIFCPIYTKVSGVGDLFVLGTTTRVTVALI